MNLSRTIAILFLLQLSHVSAASASQLRKRSRNQLRAIVEAPIEAAASPCSVNELHLPRSASVPPGELAVDVDLNAPLRGNRATARLQLTGSKGSMGMTVPVSLTCPPPVLAAGAGVRIVAKSGLVRASVPGKALQAGRVGQLVRVRNTVTHATMSGRVVDGQTVEVIR